MRHYFTKRSIASALFAVSAIFASSAVQAQTTEYNGMKVKEASAAELAKAAEIKPCSTGAYKFEAPKTNNIIKFHSTERFKRTIYIDAEKGSDKNKGTSIKKPIKTLAKLAKMRVRHGDQVLLKGNQVHKGFIELIDLNDRIDEAKNKVGRKMPRVHIGSYGGAKATIDFKGYRAGVWIENTSCVDVTDLKMTGDGGPESKSMMIRKKDKFAGQRYGIKLSCNKNIENNFMHGINIYNVDIFDVFFHNPVKETRVCNRWGRQAGREGWGWGIQGKVKGGKGMHNVSINSVNVRNVSYIGIQLHGGGKMHGEKERNVYKLALDSCTIYQVGGPGMQFNKVHHSHMKNCQMTESGTRMDNRNWGRGSGMWTWGVSDFLLSHNIFEGAQGIGDSCGAHIDFNCTNVVIEYSLSRYNAGGFVEVLGVNSNCSYRYNVSINDGWRNPKDLPRQGFWGIGALGCIFTVNGHNGGFYKGPYNTYIYNNTVINTTSEPYVNPFVFSIATSVRGLLVANNVFWFPKKTRENWGSHMWHDGAPADNANDFKIATGPRKLKNPKKVKKSKHGGVPAVSRPMTQKEIDALNIVMKNNIYQIEDCLPDRYWDENYIVADPGFKNVNGRNPEDMIPTNAAVVEQGIAIKKLRLDKTSYGLKFGGLTQDRDFFGRKITKPIVGAIAPVK